ncbi:hypothetical protein BBJ28_00022806, partial [Nothophytophthora sp. Chile5]
VQKMFDEYLEPLSLPTPNAEKLAQMHDKVREYVPEEFQNDALYAKPTDQQGEAAKSAKNARRAHRASMANVAKQNQAAREVPHAARDYSDLPTKKKRKTAHGKGKKQLLAGDDAHAEECKASIQSAVV